MNWELILCGVGGGLVANLTSWWKNVSQDGKLERYEFKFLWTTLLAGAVSGGVAQVPYIPEGWRLAVAAGGPTLIQNLLKGFSRHGVSGILADLKNPDAPKA